MAKPLTDPEIRAETLMKLAAQRQLLAVSS